MICNVAVWDRILRFLLAIIQMAYAFAGGPIWLWVFGIYFLITSAWGLCPAYAFFKIRTQR
jgi:hypothetical protein